MFAKCAAGPAISQVRCEITAQAWCGGTLSRNQRSRSASSAGAASSRSSPVVSGMESPKILLTRCRFGCVGSLTTDLWCDEDHISEFVAVHTPVTQDGPTCQPLMTVVNAAQTCQLGKRAALTSATGQISRLDSWPMIWVASGPNVAMPSRTAPRDPAMLTTRVLPEIPARPR